MSTPENGAPRDQWAQESPQSPPPAPSSVTSSSAAPSADDDAEQRQPGMSRVLRGAIWIAIGALIAAAVVCVVWVLVGPQGNALVARAFLTILLLAGFSACVLMEANLADRRPSWLVLASMVGWVLVLLVGAAKIWAPFPVVDPEWGDPYVDENVGERIWHFLLSIGVVQLAVWHQHFLWKAHQRHVTAFTRAITITTTALTGALVVMLLLYLAFADLTDFGEFYWRVVVALTILVVVGTLMIPLLNALFAPRRPRPVPQPAAYAPQAVPQPMWPTYADGRTPLPVLPDGSPDWQAYYTGVPSVPQPAPGATGAPTHPAPQAPQAAAPAAPTPAAPAAPTPPAQAAPQPP